MRDGNSLKVGLPATFVVTVVIVTAAAGVGQSEGHDGDQE